MKYRLRLVHKIKRRLQHAKNSNDAYISCSAGENVNYNGGSIVTIYPKGEGYRSYSSSQTKSYGSLGYVGQGYRGDLGYIDAESLLY